MNKVHRFYQNTRHVLRSCLLCWSDTISATERRDVGGNENTAFDREQEMTKQKFLDGEQERILSLSDYQELSLLGKGGFGQVYLVEEKCSEKKFAMKIVRLPLYICNVKTELSVLTLPDLSEFCVKMFAHFETPNYAIFILEYLAINLKDFQNLLSRIPEEAVSFYLAEVSEGMYYLHSRNMIHGDLKLENTMLDWSGHVKLIDFGVACEILINKKCRSVGCLAKEEYFENFNVCFDLRCFGLMLQSLLQGNITLCILRKSCETKTNHQISQLEFLMMKTSIEDNDTFDRNANKYEWISENSYSTTTSLSLEKDRIFDGVSQEAFDLWKALLKTVPLLGSGPSGKKDLQSHVFFEKINWEELRTRITIPPYKFKMTFQDRKNPEGELLICKNVDDNKDEEDK